MLFFLKHCYRVIAHDRRGHERDRCPLMEWAKRREAGLAESAAKEATLRERTLAKLLGGLWHTTHPDRFDAILKTVRYSRNRTFQTASVGER